MKADACCKTVYVKIIDWTPRQKKCTDHKILPLLKALCGFFFTCSFFFVRSCYRKKKKKIAEHMLSTFFLTRQLSAPALISEEEVEFPKTSREL